jgi:hypothetical protein
MFAIPAYVMGHDERERRRLAIQASILNPFTDHLCAGRGFPPECESSILATALGDVSLLAARIVERNGLVTSLDFDVHALETLKELRLPRC